MSTTSEMIHFKEFGTLCYQAYLDIKFAAPAEAEASIAPYVQKIRAMAIERNVNNSVALEILLNHLRKENIDKQRYQMEYMYFLAAYYKLL